MIFRVVRRELGLSAHVTFAEEVENNDGFCDEREEPRGTVCLMKNE